MIWRLATMIWFINCFRTYVCSTPEHAAQRKMPPIWCPVKHLDTFYLPQNRSKRYMNPVLFNPATPSRITTSDIPKLPQIRFLTILSITNYFPVYQPADTNSMHLHSTCSPYLQHLQSKTHLKSCQTFVNVSL